MEGDNFNLTALRPKPSPVALGVVLQDVAEPPHPLEARQHVDDLAHRRALDRQTPPGHRRRRAPIVGGDVIVLHRVQAAWEHSRPRPPVPRYTEFPSSYSYHSSYDINYLLCYYYNYYYYLYVLALLLVLSIA